MNHEDIQIGMYLIRDKEVSSEPFKCMVNKICERHVHTVFFLVKENSVGVGRAIIGLERFAHQVIEFLPDEKLSSLVEFLLETSGLDDNFPNITPIEKDKPNGLPGKAFRAPGGTVYVLN